MSRISHHPGQKVQGIFGTIRRQSIPRCTSASCRYVLLMLARDGEWPDSPVQIGPNFRTNVNLIVSGFVGQEIVTLQ